MSRPDPDQPGRTRRGAGRLEDAIATLDRLGLPRFRRGHPCRPRSPQLRRGRKAAERLSSDAPRAGKTTACGVVSLRRHCPDQVPGGRRSASELSPASQPFLPAPGLPGAPFGPAPSITSQTIFTLHGAGDGAWPKPGLHGPNVVFPEARGLAGRRRSCFQVWPARPFTGGGLSPGRERRSGHRAGAARCRTGPGGPPVGTLGPPAYWPVWQWLRVALMMHMPGCSPPCEEDDREDDDCQDSQRREHVVPEVVHRLASAIQVFRDALVGHVHVTLVGHDW